MIQNYKEPSGTSLEIKELKNKHSGQIVSSIDAFENTIRLLRLSESDGGREYIYLEFLPDIPNNPINDIRPKEPIVIITSSHNLNLPKVYALRNDFPLGLPHTNLTMHKSPVSLCISEETFDELKHSWSGPFFLQSIKNWLELTSINALHSEDQHLEPFIIGHGNIILRKGTDKYIEKLSDKFYRSTSNPVKDRFHKIFVDIIPLENGVVHHSVNNLFDLFELFKSKEIDLKQLLKTEILKLGDFGLASNQTKEFWEGALFVTIQIPIIRDKDNNESSFITFKIKQSLGQILSLYGFSIVSSTDIHATGDKFTEENLKVIDIELLNPIPGLDKKLARKYSNTENNFGIDSKFSLIGLGALGSQFFMNLARSGFGSWNLVDKDFLNPHNFIRHASTDTEHHTSINKAIAVSKQANNLLDDDSFSKPFPSDIASLDKLVLKESDVIIDMSTSISAEKYLANEINGTRKFSSFLNPIGSNLIVLAEDAEGINALDTLEIQYYKELILNSDFSNHLELNQSSKIRYARGCRDITSKIPQENLSIFSGIAAKYFKEKISTDSAGIEIWNLEPDYSIKHSSFEIDNWNINKFENWTIYINEKFVLDIISKHRSKKLPNETGGILIGSVDTYYRKIYITHTILSPKDSIEKPTLFIRCIDGVQEELGRIQKVTNGNLGYLGEWHSHPEKCSLRMSGDDKIQFAELLKEAELNGKPSIMLILGDNAEFKIYLDNIKI